MVDGIKERPNVRVEHPVHLCLFDSHRQRVQRVVWASPRSESIREAPEVGFEHCLHHLGSCPLDNLIFQCRDADGPQSFIGLWYIDRTLNRLRVICSSRETLGEVLQVRLQSLSIVPPRLPIDSACAIAFESVIDLSQAIDVVDVMPDRCELRLPIRLRNLSYAISAWPGGPALSSAPVAPARISLGQAPSLRPLRGAAEAEPCSQSSSVLWACPTPRNRALL